MSAIKQFLEEIATQQVAISPPSSEPNQSKSEAKNETQNRTVIDKRLLSDVKAYVNVLCRDQIDITEYYSQWIRIALGLAYSFGEQGREFFHQISSAGYPKYNHAESDKVYSDCMNSRDNSRKSKISAKSVIRFAREAGVRLQRTEKLIKDENDYIHAFNVIQEKYPAVYDSLSQDLLVDGKPFDDTVLNTIHIDLLVNYEMFVSKEFVQSVLESSFSETINQFDEFIAKHEHKQNLTGSIEKLAKCLKTKTASYLGFDYKMDMITLFMVKMVAQIYEPIPNDLCLVLLGEPYIGKTHFFQELLPKELRHLFSVQSFKGDKDAKRDAARYLLILDDEFRGLKMATSEALKSQLSLTTINLRVPYGKKPQPFKRIASYCAVSNERFILKDPTGNRRLVCFWVDSIDWELYNSIDKTELIMEAYAHYKSGFDHKLNRELLETIKLVSKEFELTSTAEETLMQYYAPAKIDDHTGSEWWPVSAIIQDAKKMHGLTLTDYEVGRALRKLNYLHKYINVNGSKLLCWLLKQSDTKGVNFKNDLRNGWGEKIDKEPEINHTLF